MIEIRFCVYLIIFFAILLMIKDHVWLFIRRIYFGGKFKSVSAFPFIEMPFKLWNRSPAEFFEICHNILLNHSETVKCWFGPMLVIGINDPRDIEAILSSQQLLTKSNEYDFLRIWLNDGLLVSSGRKWYNRRKLLTPSFHFKVLEQFVEIFNKQSEILIGILGKYKADDKVELYNLITLYSLDVICETSMGTSVQAQTNSNSNYVKAVKDISYALHVRMFNLILRNEFIFFRTEMGKQTLKAVKTIHNFTIQVIKQRRADLIQQNRSSKTHSDPTGSIELNSTSKLTFLDVLLQANVDGESLSDLDIREEVDTFMFEGHDTTASAITFCLYNIAKYPEVQKKCYQEIIETFDLTRNAHIGYATLNNLQYLEKVIKETLRLFPSVPVIGRHVTEDITLNGKTYPTGALVAIAIYNIGNNPNHFKNPDQFWPERFDDGNNGEHHTFSFIPFSAGPRNCIGQKFAILAMKSVLSKILQNFSLKLATDTGTFGHPKMVAELILKTENPLNFHLMRR